MAREGNVVEIKNVHEKVLVNALLFEAVGKGSAIIDSFSNWLLAGFAAAITFLLGNLQAVSGYVSKPNVQYCAYLFIGVLLLGILEKILATIVGSASAGAATGREIAAENIKQGIKLEPQVIFQESERAILRPMRWFVSRSFKKAQVGDLTAAARLFTLVAQIQGLIVALQVLVVLRAVYVIAKGMAF
jgi:hypothetical protein